MVDFPLNLIKRGRSVVPVLTCGLIIRLIIAPYTSFLSLFEYRGHMDLLFIAGFNPLTWSGTYSTSFYIFYIPIHVIYLVFNYFGFYHGFLINFLYKLPPIIGDLIAFYSLYNIVLLFSKDKRKSLVVSGAYFLNPFTIYMSVFMFGIDQLMMAFVLLSLLNLLKGRITHSAIYLAIAVVFKYIPILLVPFYLIHMRHKMSFCTSFLKMYLLSLLVLFSPYLTYLVPLYFHSPSAFWDHILGYAVLWTGGRGYINGLDPTTFKYNFSGILATLGLWSVIESAFLGHIFLFLFPPSYFVLMVLALTRSIVTFESINRYIIIIFSLIMLTNPVCMGHFLTWILPFLFIEVYALNSIPRHYLHILWISNFMIDPVFTGPVNAFLVLFDNTFPDISRFLWHLFPNGWPLGNLSLQLSLSALHGALLVLTTILCLFHIISHKKMGTFRQT